MSVKITGIDMGSPAQYAKIVPGDTLISINGNPITDVLDYRFYMTDEKLDILLCNQNKEVRTVLVKKGEYDDLGLEFETYLMDKQMGCRNNCMFCFVDQMPPGMRKSLYFKDDDTRMSFLFGNYTTLTNLKESDIQRIIKMHISPINISVHTTNPGLRQAMMGNSFAGESLKFIEMLTSNSIKVNTQIVLCPGMNDGIELERTISDLGRLLPNLQSIAVVPVGLTKFRDNLSPLRCFTSEEAADVIDTIEHWGNSFYRDFSARTVFASDEFYLTANRPLPDYDFYEEFDQLENGVGMMTLLKHDFKLALESAETEDCQFAKKVTIATGVLAAPMMNEFADLVRGKFKDVDVHIVQIVNHFFGETITVAGLITGRDLIEQLSGLPLGEKLLLPTAMLRHEQDCFLDDVTIEEVEKKLHVPITLVENDAFQLLDEILDQV